MKTENLKYGGLPRSLNVFFSLVGLVFLLTVFLLCAAAIKLTSSGPVFFRQKRIGQFGEPFTMYKFRTMHDKRTGPKITASDDNRITVVGRVLRKFKIDELPELLNVLRGEMAFVGPRPEVPEMVDMTNNLWKAVLSVPPGITDPVTLHLKNEEAYLAMVDDKEYFYLAVLQPFKLKGYLKYLEIRSWKSDVTMIFKTVFALFKPRDIPRTKNEELSMSALEQTF